jgi:putative ABC transport system permease protein
MFWRIVRSLLLANRARLAVILLALGSGAAVSAALLNLQVDAKKRLASEFRAFGANVAVSARSGSSSATIDGSVYAQLPAQYRGESVPRAALLYVVSQAELAGEASGAAQMAVVVGYKSSTGDLREIQPSANIAEVAATSQGDMSCQAGEQFARRLHAQAGQTIRLRNGNAVVNCQLTSILSFGGAEDSQLFLPLSAAQALAAMPGRITLAEAAIPGTPQAIQEYIDAVATKLPQQDVHGIRQFTETEANIYGRIASVLDGTILIVLVLTGLCVMAAMTSVAIERKNDVGLMKALGGATRRVLRMFLAEAAVLGFASGAVGAAVGILLSMALGEAVFGVPARPRLIVYPVVVALTMAVAIAGAYPLRRLAGIRPVVVFRSQS